MWEHREQEYYLECDEIWVFRLFEKKISKKLITMLDNYFVCPD